MLHCLRIAEAALAWIQWLQNRVPPQIPTQHRRVQRRPIKGVN
jgi:hypothetical protein